MYTFIDGFVCDFVNNKKKKILNFSWDFYLLNNNMEKKTRKMQEQNNLVTLRDSKRGFLYYSDNLLFQIVLFICSIFIDWMNESIQSIITADDIVDQQRNEIITK